MRPVFASTAVIGHFRSPGREIRLLDGRLVHFQQTVDASGVFEHCSSHSRHSGGRLRGNRSPKVSASMMLNRFEISVFFVAVIVLLASFATFFAQTL
jgi:hypothetical protein